MVEVKLNSLFPSAGKAGKGNFPVTRSRIILPASEVLLRKVTEITQGFEVFLSHWGKY